MNGIPNQVQPFESSVVGEVHARGMFLLWKLEMMKTVLVVEDEPLVRMLTSTLLRDQGFSTHLFSFETQRLGQCSSNGAVLHLEESDAAAQACRHLEP